MIQVDLFLTIMILTSLIPGLVILNWIFYTNNDADKNTQATVVEQCPFCTYIFWNLNNDHYPECPRCHSLIGSHDSKKGTSELK